MKKFIMLLCALTFVGCGSVFRLSNPFVKRFSQCNTARVLHLTGNDSANLLPIDLQNYTFYRHTTYYNLDKTGKILYKGPDSHTNGIKNIRYEMLFMAIENVGTNERNVMYFSYIPPFTFRDTCFYNQPIFDDGNLINLRYLNYIQFGKLNGNEIKFIREESISVWKLSHFEGIIKIDVVNFLDRGKIATSKTAHYLGNPTDFHKIESPNILYHPDVDDPVDRQHSNYLRHNRMHYDKTQHTIYFEFDERLKDTDTLRNLTWIRFANRVRANYSID